MQRTVMAAMAVLALPAAAAAADLTTRVERVVVYPEGALITRQARLTLPAGEHDVTLLDLPPGLSAAGVRVAVGDSAIRLGQVKVAREPRSASYDADYAAAEAAVYEQQLVVQAIDDADEAAERELTFLKGFAEGYARDVGVDGVRGGADPAAWRSALALLREGTEDARARLRANATRRLAADRELQRRRQALNALRGGARRASVVTVSAGSTQPVDTTIELAYFVDDAYWEPVYEARLDSDTGALTLLQIAEVRQETDEDWDGVALTLSTSEPSESLEPPRLESRLLSLFDPAEAEQPRLSRFQLPQAVSADAGAYATGEVIVTGAKRVEADIGSYAVDYSIPGRVDVANVADDAATFELSATRTGVELLTTVVPAESTLAFLQGRFVYSGTLPLYGSRMRLFVDGTFAGESRLPSALPGAEVTLPMGQDRRVEVSVRPQADENDRRGVIARRRYETTNSVYEITNRRPTPTLVEVIDRYPVAEDRDIRVDVSRDATAPGETDVDDRPGIVKFTRRLEADETWRIRQKYTVSYPANRELR